MPKGPSGEKRPADANACAVMVAKIATGEIEEGHRLLSGRIRSGKAGGKARAERLSAEERSRVAKKAANARWRDGDCSDVEMAMTQTVKRTPVGGEKTVRMYPNNGLRDPVRAYDTTFSAVTVIKEMFFRTTSKA